MGDLNPAQLEAVTHGDGPMLIFAGAGSGKTSTATARVQSLIERGVPPARICCVTFTNKAAGELRDRLASMVGKDAAKALWVGTFHSICARLLRAHPERSGRTASFVIYDEDDTKHVIRPILDEAEALAEKRGIKLADGALKPDRVLDEIAKQKSKGLMPGDIFAALEGRYDSEAVGDGVEERADASAAASRMRQDESERIFFEVWRDYEERMEMLDAFDFEDLMLHGMRLVEGQDEIGERLRAKFFHVLVDEYQDTNRTQFRLIRALATSRNLCAVGDPRQSIYGWRGADIEIIRGFKKHFPDARIVQLAQNYRSTKHIVAVANAIAPLGDDSGCDPMTTDNDEGEKVSVVCVRDERDEGQLVGDEIQKLVRRGAPLSSFAVLYRVHSQSRAIENELRTMDLRYKVVGGLKFFHRAEIKNAVAALRLALRPDSDIDLLRTIDAPPCGVGAATMKVVQRVAREKKVGLVAALAEVAKLPETKHKAREAVTALHGRLAEVRACITDKPIDEIVRASLVASGYKLWLTRQMTEQLADGGKGKKKAEDAEGRLANLAELVTDAARWRLRREKEEEKATLTAYLERVALLSSDDETKSEESVTLTTCHAAKGKEWEHVFVVGFEEDFFPAFPNSKTPDEITEEARVAYVALSRAKKRMWITRASVRWHQGQEKRNPPSRYIQHLPKEAITLRGHTGG
jgi:DNA helicase-2/ATP-dependent DNA helicase PcrA